MHDGSMVHLVTSLRLRAVHKLHWHVVGSEVVMDVSTLFVSSLLLHCSITMCSSVANNAGLACIR